MMKKLLIVLTVALFTLSCQQETKAENEPAKQKDIKSAFTNKMQANLAERNMGFINVNVDVLEKIEAVEGFAFIKLTVTDPKSGRSQVEYLFTDGDYVIPDVVEVASNKGLRDELIFKYQEKVSFDLSSLSLEYGNPDAKNIIVDVSDFQCPYCRRAHQFLLQKIKEENLDVAIYMMHFPLSFHKKADLYARVFEAGLKLGSNFADELYSTDKQFDKKPDGDIIDYFAKKTSDPAKFKELVNSEDIKAKIQQNMQQAQKLGISGTPYIFFNGKPVNGFKPEQYNYALDKMKD